MKTDEKLEKLRELMKERSLAAYIIPTDDFHSSEYVGEYFKTRVYMSGFTGSAGTLIVLPNEAALWTDGRYFLQAADQLSDSSIALMKMGQPGVPTMAEYLADKLEEGSVVGFDGRTVTARYVKKLAQKTADKQVQFYGDEDLVDYIWKDRPAMSMEPVWELDEKYTGLSRADKLGKVQEALKKEKAQSLLVTALDQIAWLLNLRGNDVKNTPVFLAYMLITGREAYLCVHKEILSDEIMKKLTADGIVVKDYDAMDDLLLNLKKGDTILVEEARVNNHLMDCIPEGVVRKNVDSPIELMKAIKTPEEIAHMKWAHIKDGVAVTKFMYWLKNTIGKEKITEIDAAEKLESFRAMQEDYLGPSFDPIIGYAAHGAIVHYAPTPETDVPLQPEGLCLVDTGGHYKDGTTDITRTFALGKVTEEEKRAYTLVLRSHLCMGMAQFLYGTCGQNLDVLARTPMWENGLDYNHGTGHGVGYLLNVHEGPQNIRWRMGDEFACVPLEEGMIISNEPGLYITGKFGVRHENLVLCRKGEKNEYGQFMYFETLTMVPYDRDAIDSSIMTQRELDRLNAYHKQVYDTISPYLDENEAAWLEKATAKIG